MLEDIIAPINCTQPDPLARATPIRANIRGKVPNIGPISFLGLGFEFDVTFAIFQLEAMHDEIAWLRAKEC